MLLGSVSYINTCFKLQELLVLLTMVVFDVILVHLPLPQVSTVPQRDITVPQRCRDHAIRETLL